MARADSTHTQTDLTNIIGLSLQPDTKITLNQGIRRHAQPPNPTLRPLEMRYFARTLDRRLCQRWTILSSIDHYRSKILLSLSIALTSEQTIVIDSKRTCGKESKRVKGTKKCKVKWVFSHAYFLWPILSIHMPQTRLRWQLSPRYNDAWTNISNHYPLCCLWIDIEVVLKKPWLIME